jgi:hypothetical protein
MDDHCGQEKSFINELKIILFLCMCIYINIHIYIHICTHTIWSNTLYHCAFFRIKVLYLKSLCLISNYYAESYGTFGPKNRLVYHLLFLARSIFLKLSCLFPKYWLSPKIKIQESNLKSIRLNSNYLILIQITMSSLVLLSFISNYCLLSYIIATTTIVSGEKTIGTMILIIAILLIIAM